MCRFVCVLLVRARPSQAASTSDDGRGVCSPASSRWRLSPLPIALRLTRDQLIRFMCDPRQRVRPAASASQRAYGGFMADVFHHTYLPFTADQLREHFAPVLGPGERDRRLRYYLASVEETRKYDELIRRGVKPTPAQTRLGRQMEKDERFWLATALMTLYYVDGGSARVEAFAHLLERAGLHPRSGFPRWEDALAGRLELFFEVNLPSPSRYRVWLRDHLDERTPI